MSQGSHISVPFDSGWVFVNPRLWFSQQDYVKVLDGFQFSWWEGGNKLRESQLNGDCDSVKRRALVTEM